METSHLSTAVSLSRTSRNRDLKTESSASQCQHRGFQGTGTNGTLLYTWQVKRASTAPSGGFPTEIYEEK